MWSGRTDQNKRILFSADDYSDDDDEDALCWDETEVSASLAALRSGAGGAADADGSTPPAPSVRVPLRPGHYVAVAVTEARGHTLRGRALWRATIVGFDRMGLTGSAGGGTRMGTMDETHTTTTATEKDLCDLINGVAQRRSSSSS